MVIWGTILKCKTNWDICSKDLYFEIVSNRQINLEKPATVFQK